MTIRLYNTMTRQKDILAPINPERVTLYVCGPTVYGRAHIGNFRPAVVFDVLQRLLRHSYGAGNVVYARNITDIDDKIMDQARAEGVAIDVITRRFEDFYLADAAALGVMAPDLAPHATTSIPAMIAMIAALIAKGHAYAEGDHVLFDVPSHAGYGALSRRPLDEMIAGARVEVAPYKRGPMDFVLWKPSSPEQAGWDSPWGRGRPGWHIECSAMIAEALGTTIDIHGGGIDLSFPHHENECAQSACAHDGAPLANIWMHNGFLNMGGADKMSKSLGNVVNVPDLLAQGWHGEVLRLALLSAHYRQPLEWTDEVLRQTRNVLNRWYRTAGDGAWDESADISAFVEALSDDLNTPAAIAVMGGYAKDRNRDALLKAGNLLGLLGTASADWFQGEDQAPAAAGLGLREIDALVAARIAARAAKDFAESDRIRDALAAHGIIVEDRPGGTSWRRG
ncbi:cysteine--tRNA ligase [Sandarakinorhabdus sp.]|uniref:cysteine--tRNA ligase n=1 Tax=Sandarakinorhabdus sp. TaxID=1916663 RepID=UPI00286E4ADE|nr:cysteine--tRNA ligase [Sandarakinorhabdus sp.]